MCLYCTKLEHFFKIVITSVSRALKRHHAKRGASAEAEVRENALHTTQSFKKDVVCRNANTDSVLRSNFAGGGFAKPRLIFLKFGGNSDLVSAPQEGAGGMRGGFFFGFLAGANCGKVSKMLKYLYEK